MKTAIKYLLFAVAIAPMWVAAPAKADVVYHNPRVAGAILDHCWTWGANCGRARANWWCRGKANCGRAPIRYGGPAAPMSSATAAIVMAGFVRAIAASGVSKELP